MTTTKATRRAGALFVGLLGMLAALTSYAACGGSRCVTCPGTSTTTTEPPQPPTTLCPGTLEYIGSVTRPSLPPAQIDLSLLFSLPAGATRGTRDVFATDRSQIRATATTTNITGNFAVGGAAGFSGTVQGTVDQTGAFAGSLQTTLAGGCVASTPYSGPLTCTTLTWTPGTPTNTCGGASQLTFPVAATQTNTPSISTTTTSSIAGGTTTTSSTTSRPTTSSSSTTTTSSAIVLNTTMSATITGNPWCAPVTLTFNPLNFCCELVAPACAVSAPGAQQCGTAYPSGTIVQLLSPATMAWTGCDSSNATSCTVTLNGNRTVSGLINAGGCGYPPVAVTGFGTDTGANFTVQYNATNLTHYAGWGVQVRASCYNDSGAEVFTPISTQTTTASGTASGTILVPKASCASACPGGNIYVKDSNLGSEGTNWWGGC